MSNEICHFETAEIPISFARPRARASHAKTTVLKALSSIKGGSLELIDPAGDSYRFGSLDGDPAVRMKVYNPKFFSRLVAGGSLAFGESYVDGWWDVDEDRLAEFFNLLFQGRVDRQTHMNLGAKARVWLMRALANPRSLTAARRDIQTHYDLGNDFFRLMLGPSMTYSCGYVIDQHDSLELLQDQKYARIIKKLGIGDGGTFLDIGCGWGSMLIRAAKAAPNLKGLGITLSAEQQRYAMERIAAEGLSDRVEVRLIDYRNLSGQFNFIASIGMFEHVGRASYPIFMEKLHSLLAPNGLALLHAIGSEEDGRIPQDAWISKYIFPGSELPRLEQIAFEMRKHDLIVGHVENWRPHYVRTLALWRHNFIRNWDEIKNLGPHYDDRFRRLWNYYLQFCQACFVDSTVELYQVLACKRDRWSFPMRFNF